MTNRSKLRAWRRRLRISAEIERKATSLSAVRLLGETIVRAASALALLAAGLAPPSAVAAEQRSHVLNDPSAGAVLGLANHYGLSAGAR